MLCYLFLLVICRFVLELKPEFICFNFIDLTCSQLMMENIVEIVPANFCLKADSKQVSCVAICLKVDGRGVNKY